MKQFYDEQGIRAHPKHFMVLSRAMTNYGIVHDPKDSPLVPGDYVRLSHINKSYIDITDAAGATLDEDLTKISPKFKPGYTLTEDDTVLLASKGVREVKIKTSNPEVAPVIRGIEQLALLKKDWLEKMTFRRLKGTIQEAAIRGMVSNLKGYSPLPAWIHGPAIAEH